MTAARLGPDHPVGELTLAEALLAPRWEVHKNAVREALAGEVTASKTAWTTESMEWDGRATILEITLEPFIVRGLRVDGVAAGDDEKFTSILRMAEASTVRRGSTSAPGVVAWNSIRYGCGAALPSGSSRTTPSLPKAWCAAENRSRPAGGPATRYTRRSASSPSKNTNHVVQGAGSPFSFC